MRVALYRWILLGLLLTPITGWTAPSVAQAIQSDSLDVWRRNAAMSRLELPLSVGSFFGDTMEQSFMVGAGLHVRLNPVFSLGADFGYSRLNYDPASSFGSIVTDKNLYLMEGALKISWPGLYSENKKEKEIDFYSLLGGGVMRISDSFEGTGFVGLGIKVYTRWDWLATRIEFRHHFLTVPTAGGSTFENNLILMVGPVIQLPPYLN